MVLNIFMYCTFKRSVSGVCLEPVLWLFDRAVIGLPSVHVIILSFLECLYRFYPLISDL